MADGDEQVEMRCESRPFIQKVVQSTWHILAALIWQY